MSYIALLLLLSGTLLLVSYWRWRPQLDENRPLDVEVGLPYPWASHASNVFSLTALFGAYLGIFLLKGLAATAGLAVGSVGALSFIHMRLRGCGTGRFEEFLVQGRMSASPKDEELYWIFIAMTQLGFACSEVILLLRLTDVGLDLGSADATVLAVSVAVVAYLYCLLGGYQGVYRADVLQFVAVGLMAVVAGGLALHGIREPLKLSAIPVTTNEFWSLGLRAGRAVQVVLDFGLGMAMGAGFLLASPDTWKRVMLMGRGRQRSLVVVGQLSVAGFLPFLALIPVLIMIQQESHALRDPLMLILLAPHNELFAGVFVVGLVAAFLSSFDSALLSATHILLLKIRRNPHSSLVQLARFQVYLGVTFLLVMFAAISLATRVTNAYFLANVLMGPYAAIAGTIIGSRLLSAPPRRHGVGLVLVIATVGWFVFVTGRGAILSEMTPRQIDTVPPAVGLFLLTALLTHLSGRKGALDVERN